MRHIGYSIDMLGDGCTSRLLNLARLLLKQEAQCRTNVPLSQLTMCKDHNFDFAPAAV